MHDDYAARIQPSKSVVYIALCLFGFVQPVHENDIVRLCLWRGPKELVTGYLVVALPRRVNPVLVLATNVLQTLATEYPDLQVAFVVVYPNEVVNHIPPHHALVTDLALKMLWASPRPDIAFALQLARQVRPFTRSLAGLVFSVANIDVRPL